MAANASPVLPSSPTTSKKAVAIAGIGNCVEWLDFGAYAFLAVTLGKVFFPSNDPVVSLMSSFGAFAVAFLIRPVGGVVFGTMGDRIGRKRTLALTIILMAAGTFSIGILPSYDAAGLWAPALLLAARLLQGFSAGGEYGGASTYIAEYAPNNRRGLYSSWLEFATLAGRMISVVLVLTVTFVLSADQLVAWGWRIPFLVAGPLGIIGLYLRLRLDESPEFKELVAEENASHAPLRDALRTAWKPILLCGMIAVTQNVGSYLILSYSAGFFQETLKIDSTTSLLIILAATALMMLLIPFAGHLSDKVGRRPVLLAGSTGYLVLGLPSFWLMSTGSWGGALVGLLMLSICHAAITATVPSALPALFPLRVRYTGFAVGYNVAVSVFGGTAPLIATALVAATGSKISPAYYLMGAAIMGIIAVLLAVESANRSMPGDPVVMKADAPSRAKHGV